MEFKGYRVVGFTEILNDLYAAIASENYFNSGRNDFIYKVYEEKVSIDDAIKLNENLNKK